MNSAARKCLLCSCQVSRGTTATSGPTRWRSMPAVVPLTSEVVYDTEPREMEPEVANAPLYVPPVAESIVKPKERAKPFNEIPGPKGIPVLGSLLDYVGNGPYRMDRLHLATVDRFRQFGHIYKESLAGMTHVHIIEPKDVRELFKVESKTPRRITLDPMVAYRKMRHRSIGLGNAQGEEWLRLRQPFNHLLIKPQTVNTYLPKLESCAKDFVTLIRELRTEENEVPDYFHQIHKWSLESLCDIVWDSRMGCLDSSLEENPDADKLITATQDFFKGLGELTYSLPLYKWGIFTLTWKKFVAAQDYFFETSKVYIETILDRLMKEDHAGRLQAESEHSVRTASFLESLLAMHNNNCSIVALCDMLNDLMLAAIDTTSSTFAFLAYNLAKNPDVQERLYREISSVIPPGHAISPSSLQMMPYLKACLKESMRMFPTIDGTSRVVQDDITLNGYHIPAETTVRVHCVAGLMSEYFPHPEKFIPDRWIRSSDKSKNIDPSLLVSFGQGPRMCIGRRIAEQQIYVTTIKILQNFRLEWHHQDMELNFVLTNTPSIPVQPTFIDRAA